ncbi:MAG: VOC family protein [Spirosomaceae bacterium]|nr:VOC family protein [Spirosomataceae bacterium]
MIHPIYTCLWFDGQAKEAAKFYVSIFGNSRITSDTGMIVNFELEGQKFMGLNGGPNFKFNPSISFYVMCDSVDEVNEKWAKLIDGGSALMEIGTYPWSERYGWLEDKYGVSWQFNLQSNGDVGKKILPSLLFTQTQLGNAPPGSDFEGMLMYSSSILNGFPIVAMDGPADHRFVFNEAVSFVVECDTQEEIDYLWITLTADGGQESMCGWLKDRFGVSWKIVPSMLGKLMGDPEKGQRVIQAFLQMKKFEIQTEKPQTIIDLLVL